MAKVPGHVSDPSTLETSDITFASGADRLHGYLARPKAKGSYPGIIVIHEAFGLNDHIKDLARRFAVRGYIALAPDLYSRTGTPDPADMQSVLQTMYGLSDAQVIADLNAAAAHLQAQEDINGKVGCIGFCAGGRHTLLFACNTKSLTAAVDCWGGNITRASADTLTTPARPTPVITMVRHLSCPLFAAFGEEDKNPSPDDAAKLQAELNAHKKDGTIKIYLNAGHAFLADYRPSYQAEAAFALWADATQFLDQHLKG
jgi:carboxymethylenebutenolidase